MLDLVLSKVQSDGTPEEFFGGGRPWRVRGSPQKIPSASGLELLCSLCPELERTGDSGHIKRDAVSRTREVRAHAPGTSYQTTPAALGWAQDGTFPVGGTLTHWNGFTSQRAHSGPWEWPGKQGL